MAVEAGDELAAVDEEIDAAVVAQDREGQRQRRVRHVAAADVEEPGDQFGRRQHRRRGPFLGERAAEAGALRLGALAGEALGVRHDRRERRRRLPGQTRSIGLSATGAGCAPAFSAAARKRSTSCGVCSQGS